MNSQFSLEFPCHFPIKAMGPSGSDFHRLVIEIVFRHAPDLDGTAVRTQLSRNGRYQSITVTIRATSREQLDAIYQDLTAHKQVMVAL
jgi:putative lipoic acid-binding regulatory protein